MDIAKSKDGLKARRDMEQLNVMPELHPLLQENGKYNLPMALLQPRHRREESFAHIREESQSPHWVFGEPEKASVDEGPVISLLQGSRLSYDVIVYLPIAIRAIKPEFLKMAITRMCYFFSKISQMSFHRQELSDLHDFMVETQNQLEMCYLLLF
jgi:hypothetical protein